MIEKPRMYTAIDLESYYDGDKEHPRGAMSLKSMSTVEYIRDERFEFHCMSVICPQLGIHDPARLVGKEQAQRFFDLLRPFQQTHRLTLVGNNSGFFDALVFKEVFDFWFTYHFDVMTMAGLAYGNRLKDRKLETIAQYMHLPGDPDRLAEAYRLLGVAPGETKKASAALAAVKGKRLAEVQANPDLMQAYLLYCDLDVIYSWQAFEILLPLIPETQLKVADLYYNSYLAMPLVVDVPMINQLKDEYEETRDAELDAFGETVKADGIKWEGLKSIRSADKFAQLLRDMGVADGDIPRKKSPKKVDEQGRPATVYAFSKTDLMLEEMAELYSDPDSMIPEAVRLRLEYNTSTTISKYKRFSKAGATGPWALHVKPLAAPNTARHAGGNGTGASGQNLRRAKPTQDLTCGHSVRWNQHLSVRDAVGVPEGYALAVADLNAIELRVCMTFCNDVPAMQILADPSRDMYVEDGRVYFDAPTMTKKDKDLRQAAKITDLAAQYLVGWRKIAHQARIWKVPMTPEMAQLCHAMYRQRHPAVVSMWEILEDFLTRWALGGEVNEWVGPLHFHNKGITTPDGFLLQYPDLKQEWVKLGRSTVPRYSYYNAPKRCRVFIHVGGLMENLSQSLAAQVFNHITLRIVENTQHLDGIMCGSVHDELLMRFPQQHADAGLAIMIDEMAKPVPWWPELTTRGEGDCGFSILETSPGVFRYESRYGCLK